MVEPVVLPAGVAVSSIAFLLSLLPAGLFLWLWYLRRIDRPVPTSAVVQAFVFGGLIVGVAAYLERWLGGVWKILSPATAHYVNGPILPLQGPLDILLPAVGTFFIVAAVEEGLRWAVLGVWLRRSSAVDQVFDGLVLGIAVGLGFATVENTIYFFGLLQNGHFNTLLFVFFLRFLISTLAHLSFAGVMGTLLARSMLSMYRSRTYLLQAFFIPWIGHGLFDLLLSLNFSLYAILTLVPFLSVLAWWAARRDFFIVSRRDGRPLVFEEHAETKRSTRLKQFLRQFESPWNKDAPWMAERSSRGQLLRDMEDV